MEQLHLNTDQVEVEVVVPLEVMQQHVLQVVVVLELLQILQTHQL
tara:strand:+ start:415 stop:549 length:135 start_codon:yes stop_codon:yes gene_type:complete